MRTFLSIALATAAAYAGGFHVELANPAANKEAVTKNAVLVARITGCHNPEKAALEATAEGIVDGRRQSIPLKPIALSIPGAYAIERQWPSEGKWIVRLVARDPALDRHTSVLAKATNAGVDRTGARWAQRAPTSDEVEAMLKRTE